MATETIIAPRAHAAPASRWLALDVFRALAVLWMIQGHTFTALLGADVFGGGLGEIYRMLHGLTAPMFLCGAGLAYGIVTFSASAGQVVISGAAWRLPRRALMLLAIGTCLQLPAAPLADVLQRRELLSRVLQPGALQLVAACLVLAELLRHVCGGRLRFAAAAAVTGTVVALVAPLVWQLGASSRFVLGSWLDGQTGAQFPAVPWLCFFLWGASLAAVGGTGLWRERWRMPFFGVLGLGASALCYWQFAAGQRLTAIYGAHAFWLTSPLLVVFRAGLVLAWLAVLSAASGWITRSFAAWPGLARLISALSRHSLVAYVVHLGMLYGLPLQARSGYSLVECSLVCALVLCISVLSVLHWERVRALVVRKLSAWSSSAAASAQLAARTARRSASRSAGLTK